MNVEDVSNVLFTQGDSTEPMVFYVPNKAVRNILKLHVNVSGNLSVYVFGLVSLGSSIYGSCES